MNEGTKERNCADCSHCVLKVRFAPTTGAQITAEFPTGGNPNVFSDSNVRQIRCAKNVWAGDFSSMAVFNVSALPREAAANCPYFDGEGEE